jgi:hypothetical protein
LQVWLRLVQDALLLVVFLQGVLHADIDTQKFDQILSILNQGPIQETTRTQTRPPSPLSIGSMHARSHLILAAKAAAVTHRRATLCGLSTQQQPRKPHRVANMKKSSQLYQVERLSLDNQARQR